MKSYNSLITDKDNKPLRILMIAKHCCIRVIREADALKSIGYKVDLLTNKISFGTEIFDTVGFWHNEQQLKSFLHDTKGRNQIVMCHNEPDEMTYWSRDVLGVSDKFAIIHNCHDSDLIRRKLIPVPERRAYLASDAVIYVSEPIQEICNGMHQFTKPTTVLYNYPTLRMINETEVNWDLNSRKNLVYEGGVNSLGEDKQSVELNKIYPYRNLFPLFQQLISQGNEVNVYAGNSDAFQTGQNIGCVMHPPTIFDKLLEELSKYRYNLVVFNNAKGTEDQVNFTTANKIWDALAAGLPSLVCYCPTMQDYIKKHDIGWSFDNIESIGNCSQLEGSYDKKIANIKQKRQELIFENQIWRDENLFATLLGVEKKSIPDRIKAQAVFEYGEESTNQLLSK